MYGPNRDIWRDKKYKSTLMEKRTEERSLWSLKQSWEDDIEININPYPTAFPYGNGMVLHFYQQQESSTTKTVHKVINKRLKTYV